jgi:hypothetical protein
VKLLVEWNGVLLALLSSCIGALVVSCGVSALFVNAGQTHASIELSNLVSVLTGSRHFNGSRPIEVEMTERKSEMLYVNLSKL